MARARNIKPGFFTNEDIVDLDFWVRLMFIGLWTLADREGRLENRPKKIKMALFPCDPIDAEDGLSKLRDAGFLTMYSINGNEYIQIVNFKKHQNPHVKEVASTIPAPDSMVLASEREVPAVLVTDSPFLVTDPLNLNPDNNIAPTALVEIPPTAEVSPAPKRDQVPIKDVVSLYHELLPMLPRVEKITKAREGYIRQRWTEDLPNIESWGRYFRFVSRSKFLTGKAQATNGRPPFRADIEFLCKPASFAKIAENKYHEGSEQ